MTIKSTAQSKLYISTTVADFSLDQDAAALQTAFEGLTYTQVKELEDMGEFGDQANELTFNSIEANRVRRIKGLRDGGTMTVVVGRDPGDAGQTAMRSAAAAQAHVVYGFKIELDDNPDEAGDGTPTTFYWAGPVMGFRTNFGQGDNIIRDTYTIAVNSDVIEVAADAGEA